MTLGGSGASGIELTRFWARFYENFLGRNLQFIAMSVNGPNLGTKVGTRLTSYDHFEATGALTSNRKHEKTRTLSDKVQ